MVEVTRNGPSSWIKGVAWILAVVIPAFSVVLISFYNAQLDFANKRHQDLMVAVGRLQDRITDLVVSTATLKDGVVTIREGQEYWTRRIEANTSSLNKIATDAVEKPRVLTIVDGKEIEKRLSTLEKCPREIELINGKIDALTTNFPAISKLIKEHGTH